MEKEECRACNTYKVHNYEYCPHCGKKLNDFVSPSFAMPTSCEYCPCGHSNNLLEDGVYCNLIEYMDGNVPFSTHIFSGDPIPNWCPLKSYHKEDEHA